jgi:cell division septation protein DedD
MASRGRKGGDFVLESRHLVGLFLLLVVIFGIVFTLGYLLGRSQYDSRLRAAVGNLSKTAPARASSAAETLDKPENKDPLLPPGSSDWDFYHAADPKQTDDRLQPVKKTAPKPQAAAPKTTTGRATTAKRGKISHSLNGPLIPKGAIMLQVAAVQRESDALALAQALQQKKFPAFVITPSVDKYYRIQVGPYADPQSAAVARRELEAKGFKSIVKR